MAGFLLARSPYGIDILRRFFVARITCNSFFSMTSGTGEQSLIHLISVGGSRGCSTEGKAGRKAFLQELKLMVLFWQTTPKTNDKNS
jgi:hypothetical protein